MSIIHYKEVQMIRILNKDGQLLAEVEADSLRNAMLANKYLKGAQLAGQDLTGANLDDANLSHANLSGAILEGVSLQKTELEEADLSMAKLDGATLKETNLRKANLEKASAVGAIFTDVNLSGAWSRESDYRDAQFMSTEQSRFQMNNADFSGSTFDNASILGADVSYTCFFGTDFSKATIGLECRAAFEHGLFRYYPLGSSYSEDLLNPFFDCDTRWPSNIKFPTASLPWLLIVKHAGIIFFYIVFAILSISYFTAMLLGSSVLSDFFTWTLLIIIAGLCLSGSIAWFLNRTKLINAEIEKEPSLHYGQYFPARYELGKRIGEREKEECQKFRK